MKPAHVVTIALLVILACVQTLRLLLRWEVNVNGVSIPLWASAVAIVVVLSVATALWREVRHAAAGQTAA